MRGREPTAAAKRVHQALVELGERLLRAAASATIFAAAWTGSRYQIVTDDRGRTRVVVR